jgi:hypothetical protein
MTNPIGGNATSAAAAKAASVFGSARQTLKAMAEAASAPAADRPAVETAAGAPEHVRSRQGRTLDRYA